MIFIFFLILQNLYCARMHTFLTLFSPSKKTKQKKKFLILKIEVGKLEGFFFEIISAKWTILIFRLYHNF